MQIKGVSLAEFEEDFLKDQDRSSAAQDSEGLPSKQRISYTCHRGSKQRLYCTLKEKKEEQIISHIIFNTSVVILVFAHVLTMRPSVASPSRPPKVITGDMQAQYRKRKEARHCKLMASV